MTHMPEKHAADLSSVVIAPMPGMVKTVNVVVGQPVSKTQIRTFNDLQMHKVYIQPSLNARLHFVNMFFFV